MILFHLIHIALLHVQAYLFAFLKTTDKEHVQLRFGIQKSRAF